MEHHSCISTLIVLLFIFQIFHFFLLEFYAGHLHIFDDDVDDNDNGGDDYDVSWRCLLKNIIFIFIFI